MFMQIIKFETEVSLESNHVTRYTVRVYNHHHKINLDKVFRTLMRRVTFLTKLIHSDEILIVN